MAGVTVIETSVAMLIELETVRVAAPVTPSRVAVIVVEPGALPNARPDEVMVATAALLEDHVAVAVTSWVVPSPHPSIAVNCCVEPCAIVGAAGLT